MTFNIFDIKRYAINDGPGIRTTLFFKGCPLRCAWCHNPESWSTEPQLVYRQSRCIGCQTCVSTCPNHLLEMTTEGIRPTDTDQCRGCNLCTQECPTRALEMCGREWTLDELMAEVEKEREVMTQSGGGVTLCGGEPLMHPEEALALLTELKQRGFHTAVDTSLQTSPTIVGRVAPVTDLFLADLKLMDSAQHKQYTGKENELILNNIRLLNQLGADFWIRIPLIEGVNADDENIIATADFLSSLTSWKSRRIHLLPFHDVAQEKHRRLFSLHSPLSTLHNSFSIPNDETLQHIVSLFESRGYRVIVGG